MNWKLTSAFALTSALFAAQTIPPQISRVSPPGARRGTTVTLTIGGRNLSGAKAVLFDAPGFAGELSDVKDLTEPPRKLGLGAEVPLGKLQEAKLKLTAGPQVATGVHRFRLQTALGTSNEATFEVGALPEITVMHAPDSGQAPAPQPVELPVTLVGTLNTPGEVDSFQFAGRAGQQLVFEVVAETLGSQLRSILSVRDSAGKELAREGDRSRRNDAVLLFRVPADGQYTLALADLENHGGSDSFYRLHAGALPYITDVFPLGVRAGHTTQVAVSGANLGDIHSVTVQAPGALEGWKTIPLRVKTAAGESLNEVKLAVGNEPEIAEAEPNDSAATAQRVPIPIAINGRITGGEKGDEDYFRFHATRGQRLLIEVAARRLGSSLDSVIEVLDAEGRDIPRATLRAVLDTQTTLADRDSATANFRFVSNKGFNAGDYAMIADELDQIEFVPDQPDEDVVMRSYAGMRMAELGTSPQVHPIDMPVYKVQVLSPDEAVVPNGLPVFHLTARNDDGGPGYGSDSRLDFTAPADGDYVLRIKDVRGIGGNDFPYRLSVREVQPDFRIAASPSNPNLPRGGQIPITVSIDRRWGFSGPVELEARGLPQGVSASHAHVAAGAFSGLVVLSAAADALASTATHFEIVARATIGKREVIRRAGAGEPLQVVALLPQPDIRLTVEPREVVLEPGKTATVTLRVSRANGFAGRVPYNVMNMPPGVRIDNVGFTGGFVTEQETVRKFELRAETWAKPVTQPIYLVGSVESNASTEHVSAPIVLKILGRRQAGVGTGRHVAGGR